MKSLTEEEVLVLGFRVVRHEEIRKAIDENFKRMDTLMRPCYEECNHNCKECDKLPEEWYDVNCETQDFLLELIEIRKSVNLRV